ncbi:MAG: response regulator [Burkholderiales bacterium]|nr:MAG: response regulator [Burkholderiales bacterium]
MCSAHSGKPLLIVEDEWLVAASMVDALQDAGYDIAGPVSRPRDALRLIASREIAGALLDINLRGEQSFSIADEHARRTVIQLVRPHNALRVVFRFEAFRRSRIQVIKRFYGAVTRPRQRFVHRA